MLNIPLTIGIEEEYQIIDPQTRELTSYVQQLLDRSRVVLGDQVKPELMQSQIEAASLVCRNVQEARQEIIRLRRTISELAEENGREIMAASTHPFSRWEKQTLTEGERYKELETNMQEVGRRLLIFGMHIHVGFGKSPEALELLVEIQNQMRYFLPHLLALSTSSPFWHGRDTGLKSYRSIIFKSMPRTGIPPTFASFAEYANMVSMFARSGSLGKGKDKHSEGVDATRIWWDARPQVGFGTLEIRVCDMCTTIDETIAITALIQALAAKLIRLRQQNISWRKYRSVLIEENKWRAVRYGVDGNLVDFGKLEEVPMRFLANELIALVDDVLDELGSRREVESIRAIVDRGTSADRQLATYRKAVRDGASTEEALRHVVDQLIRETAAGWKSSA